MTYRFNPDRPLVLGIIGGIASGKSTVCALFADHGLAAVDADQIAREVSERPRVLTSLRQRFPPELFAPDGSLHRGAMAELVFGDEAAKRTLEGVLHPLIREEILRGIDDALARGQSVVLDAPLLLERGLIDRCDACIYIDADPAARTQRAKARGWSAEELRQREENQAPEAMKIAGCAYTIGNSGSLAKTRERVIEVLAGLEANPGRDATN